MPSQGTQCTPFPIVHPSASVLLPELSCFWQLVSITRSPCTGRSYFAKSMKLLFLAEKKQLLSRKTKLARLCSALLWTTSSQIVSMHCLGSIMQVHMARDHSSTQWSGAQNFVLRFSLFSTAHAATRLSLCRG